MAVQLAKARGGIRDRDGFAVKTKNSSELGADELIDSVRVCRLISAAILEKLSLPLAEHRRVDAVLVAQMGHGSGIEQLIYQPAYVDTCDAPTAICSSLEPQNCGGTRPADLP